MATHKETGVIEKTYEGAHIEWRIPEFSTVSEIKDLSICYESPAFFINGVTCHLELFPVSGLDSEFMRLYLRTNEYREYSLEYNVCVKKSDGSAEQLVYGILKGNNTRHDVGNLIKKTELLQKKSDLAPENTLTILCKFKRVISCSIQTQPTGGNAPMKLIRLDKLSENFKDLFGDQDTCDTTLKVKDKEYKAHKSVLIARSRVFAATFKHDTLERQTGFITITDCDPDSFEVFLEYLYSGKLEELSVSTALNLYYTCDKYDVQELKTFCVEYLMQQLTVENVCEVAGFANKYDETALFSSVQDFFNENASKVFATSEWQCFMIKENRLASKLLLEMSKVKLKN